VTTYTLTGDLGDLIGVPLEFPSGQPVRAFLLPDGALDIVDGEIRLGSVELTVDSSGVFTQTDVPRGDHRVQVLHFDPEQRQPKTTLLAATVAGDTTLTV
jgi:hypothetical protein